MSQPFHFKLLFNNKLDDDDIINILKLLEEHNKDILTMMDDMGYNIAHAAILRTEEYDDNNEGLKLLKYSLHAIPTVAAPTAYSNTKSQPIIHANISPIVA